MVYTVAVVALIIKVVGYYFTEVILYSSLVLPFGSIPGNIMQVAIADIIVVPIVGRLKKRARIIRVKSLFESSVVFLKKHYK